MPRCEVCAGNRQLIMPTNRLQELKEVGIIPSLVTSERQFGGWLVWCWECSTNEEIGRV